MDLDQMLNEHLKIESLDRHIFELYFTPPGEKERLVARAVYNRQKLSRQ